MRTNTQSAFLAFAMSLGVAGIASADTLELRSGAIVQGKFVGGTATTVRIETAEGVQVYSIVDALALTFSGAQTPATPAPPPTVAPAAVAPVAVTVPAGTVLTVRMDAQVSSTDAPGKKFSAKLVADLLADGRVIARAGATVYGQVEAAEQAGRMAGKSKLAMTLTGIDNAGTIQPIFTTNFSEAGASSGRKTVRNVAVGAAIGGIADGGDGAKTGAAIGAGASLIRKGESVTVPAGAILEFRLAQPFQTKSVS